MHMFRKSFRWAILYALLLSVFTAYVMLDTFVIPRVLTPAIHLATAEAAEEIADSAKTAANEAVITETSYTDDNIQITIETLYAYDTAVYIADIRISDVSYLKTAFANAAFGRNITDTTSDIAEDNSAIFAVNGDFYGFRNSGYVIRIELAIDIGQEVRFADFFDVELHFTVLKRGSSPPSVNFFNAARARPSRDISVPIGISRAFAASA